jgi:hypothetical protein
MIVTAIAVMSAQRHEDTAIQQCKSAALVLRDRVEIAAARSELNGNVDREPGITLPSASPRP